MTSENATHDSRSMDDVWRQIEHLMDQIAELSKADLPEQQFYAAVLDGAVRTGAATGGAVWTPERGDHFRLEQHTNLDETHRNQQLRRLRNHQASWNRIERFAERVHSHLDLDATAYTLANEGRRLIDCDRLTVAVRQGSGFTVLAISGVDVVDRRANAIRQLEQLAHRVATIDEPLWYTGRERNLPPEIGNAAQSYVDRAHPRSLAAVPLKKPPIEDAPGDAESSVGVLVFEWFGSEAEQNECAERIRTVCRHGTLALANAVACDSIPLVRISRHIRWLASPKRLPKLLTGLVALAAMVTALVLVKADFSIQCRGQLQPKVRRNVFAPLDGEVERLAAKHGDRVASGQTLATLRSSKLEYEYTRLLGETQTTTEQLNAARASRLDANPTTASERDEYARLTAEEERLKNSLENLHQQKELLEDQRDRLEVRSPIRGQVLTWEVTEVLETRPVGRGRVLMTVAVTEGPWVLEVRVPDRHIGYVRQARRQVKRHLDVTFVLATDPGTKHRGKVEKVALITEPDEAENLTVLVTIAFDRNTLTDLHPGAGATARIDCGRRSVGYVWLHDLIEAVRSRFFL